MDRLFDVPPLPEPLKRDPADSATVARTKRRRALLAAGTHPTSKQPLKADTGDSCGSCVHRYVHKHNLRRYHKCLKSPGGLTFGPATDVNVGWPACVLWEAENG